MTAKFPLTRQTIERLVEPEIFSRGNAYYQKGAISNLMRRGDTIQAVCAGYSWPQYKVSVTFKNEKLTKTSCNCKYDGDLDCKHIVALLLTLLHSPDSVKELPNIAKLLAKRSKDDLIILIGQMVERYPELMPLINIQGFDEIITSGAALDLNSIRKQLKKIFTAYEVEEDEFDDDDYDEYGNTPTKDPTEASLHPITDLAMRFSKRGDWHNATLLYQTVLTTFTEWVGNEFYDTGGLTEHLQDVIVLLDDCLNQPSIKTDVATRQSALESLMGLFLWDIHYIEIETDLEILQPILQHIQPDDSAFIRQLIAAGTRKKFIQEGNTWPLEMIEKLRAKLDELEGNP